MDADPAISSEITGGTRRHYIVSGIAFFGIKTLQIRSSTACVSASVVDASRMSLPTHICPAIIAIGLVRTDMQKLVVSQRAFNWLCASQVSFLEC